jgi:prophage DNA circulation protein
MAWRDQLRKASFRGVEFFIDGAEFEVGRRNVTHEYPLRDQPYVEDLGRKARVVTLEAFVIATAANGFNYMPGRDALIAALELAGPGVLVHPYLGEMRVSLTSPAKVNERTKEGGLAKFALTFTESGEPVFPSSQANTPSIVNLRADAAETAITKDFAKKFGVGGMPDSVSKAATALLGNVGSLLRDVTKLIPTDPLGLAEYLPGVSSFSANLTSLVQTPTDLAKSVIAQVDKLRSIAKSPAGALGIPDPRALLRNPMHALQMLRKLLDFGKPGTAYPTHAVPLTVPSRIQEADNQEAVTELVQRSAVVSAARSSAETDYATFDDAASVREELAERMDTLMVGADADDVYNALAALRAATIKDITARGADRARLVDYTPIDSQPALVLAYALHDDASRDSEIITRNLVRHPGFVPGGRPIKVLADA